MLLPLVQHPLQPRYWFGTLDTRPVAVFRILFALLLLKNAFYHLPLVDVFFSDAGVLPREALFDGLARSVRWSLLDAVGASWLVTLIVVLWIAVLIALLLGYRARLMAILNFILILSFHERNIYIITGADSLMRVLSFWLMFAPLADHYALDALRRQRPATAFALPVRLLQWQVIIVYLVTGYLKWIGDLWLQGDALYYVLQSDTVLLPFGVWMATWPPSLLRGLTYATLIVEIAIPVLLLSPFWPRASRLLAFMMGLLLHGGIALTLAIPDFSILMLICYVLFFEPRWLSPLDRLMAKIQRRFGTQSPASTPDGAGRYKRMALAAFVLPIFALVIAWNITYASEYTAPDEPLPYAPGSVIVEYLGLWQYWDMYAPLPVQYDGWIEIIGRFENGYQYDVFGGRFLSDPHPTRWYWGPSMRWEKYEENAYRWQRAPLLRGWADYYCRKFNVEQGRIAGTRLADLEIIMRLRDFHAPDAPPNALYTVVLWRQSCLTA